MYSRCGYAVSSADGTPIYYECSKPPLDVPSGRAMVLSDGIGCDGYVWKRLEGSLATHGQVIHWHYRGHGRTPAPNQPHRLAIEDCADDLASVLDDIALDRALLLGHSMGVQVVLESLRRHPDRVAGLILVCGAPGNPLRTFGGTSRLEQLLPKVKAAVSRAPWLASRLSRRLLPRSATFALAARLEINGQLISRDDFMPYLRGLSLVDTKLFLDMLTAAGKHSADDLLEHVRVPTLIIAGERDGFTPVALSQRMHAAIRESELLIIKAGSHTAPLERPEVVERAVLRFIHNRVWPP